MDVTEETLPQGVTFIGNEVHNGVETSVYGLAAGSYHFGG